MFAKCGCQCLQTLLKAQRKRHSASIFLLLEVGPSRSFHAYGPTLSCPLTMLSHQAYWGNVQGLPVKHLDVPVAEEVAD